MNRMLHFIQYHNAVPVALGLLFLGAGGAYAATNPEIIFDANEQVISIDNTYIAAKNLDAYTPRAQITGVTEDAENYYVAFRFSTIDLADAIWQDVVKDEVMTVSKADLGPYRDLGIFVAEQLRQKITRELQRLRETQEFERRNVSRKMVATAYTGLVGRLLDDSTEELPGYVPVVTPPAPSVAVFTEPTPFPVEEPVEPRETHIPPPEENREEPRDPAGESPDPAGDTSDPAPETGEPAAPAATSTGLAIQMLGDNPARIATGETYTDLGAVASNDANEEIAVAIFVNGVPADAVSIDTAAPGSWTIRYVATDAGGSVEATRTVEVYAPAPAETPETPAPSEEPATPEAPAAPPEETPVSPESAADAPADPDPAAEPAPLE